MVALTVCTFGISINDVTVLLLTVLTLSTLWMLYQSHILIAYGFKWFNKPKV